MPRINNLGGGGFTGFASMTKQPSGAPSPGGSSYLQGSYMIFSQTSAPTDWTKSTTYDDYSLRVTSGTAGVGGTDAFTTVFANRSVNGGATSPATFPVTIGAVALSPTQVPDHLHTIKRFSSQGARRTAPPTATPPVATATPTTATNGTGGLTPTTVSPHTHSFPSPAGLSSTITWSSLDFAVKYLDIIIASRN